MAVTNAVFSVGSLMFIPSGTNPTPIQIGTLDDVSLEIQQELVPLMGEKSFPVAYAKGKGKISGKAKTAYLNADLLTAVVLGAVKTTGQKKIVRDETASIPTTPFQITTTNSATWYADLGVVDLTSGVRLTRVASAPATTQYSVAAGVYTFAAADTGHSVAIYYYTVAGSGSTVTVTNAVMAETSSYQLILGNTPTSGTSYLIDFPAVHIPTLSMSMKSGAWSEQNLSFEVAADSAGTVARYYIG